MTHAATLEDFKDFQAGQGGFEAAGFQIGGVGRHVFASLT
jgi:hypothetical protein